jgi:hypothetical protein
MWWCSDMSKHSYWSIMAWVTIWGWALSCNNTTLLAVISAFIHKLVMQHLTAACIIYCYHLIGWDWDFAFSGLNVFSFHTLTFALWFSVVDWCCVTNGIETQKYVSLLMIPFQNAITYIQMSIPLLVHELFWNTFCTNFVEVKSVLNDFISRTMTTLHLVCQFAHSHCRLIQKECADLFSVLLSS